MPDEKLELLIAAIGELDINDAAHFTGDGKPSANVLKEKIGEAVSAEERDTAWTEFQERAAENVSAAVIDLAGASSVITMDGGKAVRKWYRDGKLIYVGPDPSEENE